MGLLILLTEVVCNGFHEKFGSIAFLLLLFTDLLVVYFRTGGLDQISAVVSEGRSHKLCKKQLLLHNN